MDCKHQNIKYFERKDRVICLDCGEDWLRDIVWITQPIWQVQPLQPFWQIPNMPQPSWPTITCASSDSTIPLQ